MKTKNYINNFITRILSFVVFSIILIACPNNKNENIDTTDLEANPNNDESDCGGSGVDPTKHGEEISKTTLAKIPEKYKNNEEIKNNIKELGKNLTQVKSDEASKLITNKIKTLSDNSTTKQFTANLKKVTKKIKVSSAVILDNVITNHQKFNELSSLYKDDEQMPNWLGQNKSTQNIEQAIKLINEAKKSSQQNIVKEFLDLKCKKDIHITKFSLNTILSLKYIKDKNQITSFSKKYKVNASKGEKNIKDLPEIKSPKTLENIRTSQEIDLLKGLNSEQKFNEVIEAMNKNVTIYEF